VSAVVALLDDEVGRAATVTLIGGAADPNYPVTNVNTTDAMTPFLTSSTGSAITVSLDHGAAQRVDLISLHGLNIPAGTNVRAYRSNTADFSVLAQDGAVTIQTYGDDGLPFGTFVDLRTVAGYNVSGFRYTGIHVPAIAQKVGLGSILVWSEGQLIANVRYPVRKRLIHPSRVFRTAYGSKKVYGLGVRLQEQDCEFLLKGTDHDVIIGLIEACRGQEHSFLWVPDYTKPEVWLASFTEDSIQSDRIAETVALADGGRWTMEFTIEELSNGLALPTS
jgi:hypothetical protein